MAGSHIFLLIRRIVHIWFTFLQGRKTSNIFLFLTKLLNFFNIWSWGISLSTSYFDCITFVNIYKVLFYLFCVAAAISDWRGGLHSHFQGSGCAPAHRAPLDSWSQFHCPILHRVWSPAQQDRICCSGLTGSEKFQVLFCDPTLQLLILFLNYVLLFSAHSSLLLSIYVKSNFII